MTGRVSRKEEKTAIHEAGHVVMLWWLGVPVIKATIVPKKSVVVGEYPRSMDSLGHVLSERSMKVRLGLPFPNKRNHLEAQICMIELSGAVANKIDDPKHWVEMTTHEYGEAMNIARSIFKTEINAFKFVYHVAGYTELVLREHWNKVKGIAEQLASARTLTVYALL